MGVQSTQTVTKEEARYLIANTFRDVIIEKLKNVSVKKLQHLLDEYVEDTFTNYDILCDYDDYENDDINSKDFSFIDNWLNNYNNG